MDNKLDFFNVVSEYQKTLAEDDALLVLSHNSKNGDCIQFLSGDWEILSALLSEEENLAFTEGDNVNYRNIQKAVLSIAYNIIMKNEEYKKKFLEKVLA